MKDVVVDWDDGRRVGVLDLLNVVIGLQNSHSGDHGHRWTQFGFQDMLIRG